jgi:hypothetical protein
MTRSLKLPSQLTTDTIENLSRTLAEDRQNSRSSKEQVQVIVNPCHSSSDKDMLEFTNCLQTYVKLEGLAGNTVNNAPISRYLCDKGLVVKLVWIPDKDKTQRSLRIEFRYQERVSTQIPFEAYHTPLSCILIGYQAK